MKWLKIVVFLYITITMYADCENYTKHKKWEQISNQRIFSVSGLVHHKNGFLIVHDNKRDNQPRISFFKNNKISPLIWPDSSLPYDLEAISIIPSFKNQYILMESTGKCYKIKIEQRNNQITLMNVFQLETNEGMNLEGCIIVKGNFGYKIMYGDRGSDLRKSTLFIGDFNPINNNITNLVKHIIDLPAPSEHKRNIADLGIDKKNNLWTSATSDPGNDGPFETYLYKLGHLSKSGILNLKKTQKSNLHFENQKVEALYFYKSYILLMTDNENFGANFIKIKKRHLN